jgi:hypothetical protein
MIGDVLIGFILGFFSSKLVSRKTWREVGVQADEVWGRTLTKTKPVEMPYAKAKFVPRLQNFWGPDS